ncbi:MAG: hypothetical protein K2I95_10510 [Treponemataceae bacterium]|nr:hypothetical protein [Treponemataceae bacterium]
MKAWIISLISGLFGVIVGSVYENFLSKNQIRQGYKKESIDAWVNLRVDMQNLFSNFNARNHIYFRQIFLLKIVLLNNIGNTCCSKNKVKKLVENLKNIDEKMSLDGVAEMAFCKDSKNDDKINLENEIFHIIIDTVKKIQNI